MIYTHIKIKFLVSNESNYIMKKYRLGLLSTVFGLSLCMAPVIQAATIQGGQTVSVKKVDHLQRGKVKYYGGTRFIYYPNRVIVADGYNEGVIRNIVGLSRLLGWDTVYIQDLPESLRTYARQYFSDNDIYLNYLSDDAVVTGPEYSVPYEDDDTDILYYNAIPYEPDVFYGYGGNGYYYGDRGYYLRHHGGGGGGHGGYR